MKLEPESLDTTFILFFSFSRKISSMFSMKFRKGYMVYLDEKTPRFLAWHQPS